MEDYLLQLKEVLYGHCVSYVDQRIRTAEQAMKHAQEAANAEGKSSAGDKYETGRAMMQIERDKAAQQVEEALKLKRMLEHIRTDVKHEVVATGSLLLSDTVNFYIAISAGKIVIESKEFITIAPNVPVAHVIMNLKVGDTFLFNKKQHFVRQVL